MAIHAIHAAVNILDFVANHTIALISSAGVLKNSPLEASSKSIPFLCNTGWSAISTGIICCA